jgi:hypothetical protein
MEVEQQSSYISAPDVKRLSKLTEKLVERVRATPKFRTP